MPANVREQNSPLPVLMIPMRRCGSHALRLRLNASPQFYAPYPLHIVDFMPLLKYYGDLSDDGAYFQLIIDVVGLQTTSMIKWEGVVFDPVSLFNSLSDRPRSVHSIIWGLLFAAGHHHGARVVMDKSLDSVHYAEELMTLFGDMLLLNVVRDPRAQVNSINRAIIHEFNTLLNTQIWVKAHDRVRQLQRKYPERVLTIRFEDFLANQEVALRKICLFFGIDFMPEMLDISRSQEAHSISMRSALWESNASQPIMAHADKFKRDLSATDIEIIETLACDHMDYYGYERLCSGKADIGQQVIAQAKQYNKVCKTAAWEALRKTDYQDFQLRRLRADYIGMVERRLRGGPSQRIDTLNIAEG